MKYSIVLVFVMVACSSENIYIGIQEDNTAQKALTLLEKEQVDKAIDLLEKSVEKNPDDYQLWSILASAYAQKAGIDIIRIALLMGEESSENSSTNPHLALWSALPAASEETMGLVEKSLNALTVIPSNRKIKADMFKESFIGMAGSSLILKALDIDQDGILSPEELVGLSQELASAVIAAMYQASVSATSLMIESDTNASGSIQKVTTTLDQILNQEGQDYTEKLVRYLQ